MWRNCAQTVYEILDGTARSPTVKLVDRLLSAAVLLSLAGFAFSFRRKIGTNARKVARRVS